MTNQEKDQLSAEIGKNVPENLDYDQNVSLESVLAFCLRHMGVGK